MHDVFNQQPTMRSPSSHSTPTRSSPSPASTAKPCRQPALDGGTDPQLLQNARNAQSIYRFSAPVTFEDLRIGAPHTAPPTPVIFYDGPDKAEIALNQEERAQLDYVELMQMKGRAHVRQVDKHWKHNPNPLELETRLQRMFQPAPVEKQIDLKIGSPGPLVYRAELRPNRPLARMDDFYGMSDAPTRARSSRASRPNVGLTRSPKAARIPSPRPRSALELPEVIVRDMHSSLLVMMSDEWMDDIQNMLSKAGPEPKFTGLQDQLKALQGMCDITRAYLVHGSGPAVTACNIRPMLATMDRLIAGLKALGQNPRRLVAARELAAKCVRAA